MDSSLWAEKWHALRSESTPDFMLLWCWATTSTIEHRVNKKPTKNNINQNFTCPDLLKFPDLWPPADIGGAGLTAGPAAGTYSGFHLSVTRIYKNPSSCASSNMNQLMHQMRGWWFKQKIPAMYCWWWLLELEWITWVLESTIARCHCP